MNYSILILILEVFLRRSQKKLQGFGEGIKKLLGAILLAPTPPPSPQPTMDRRKIIYTGMHKISFNLECLHFLADVSDKGVLKQKIMQKYFVNFLKLN